MRGAFVDTPLMAGAIQCKGCREPRNRTACDCYLHVGRTLPVIRLDLDLPSQTVAAKRHLTHTLACRVEQGIGECPGRRPHRGLGAPQKTRAGAVDQMHLDTVWNRGE